MIKTKPEKQRSSFEQMMYTANEYESSFFNEVDKVIALSHHMQSILISDYQIDADKITVIPNGLNDLNPTSVIDKEMLWRKWCLSEKEFIILFVGRFHSVKGLIFLIKAFRKVLEKFPHCRLMIAGNGNYDVYLREAKGICTKITFTGLLEKVELCELYQIANVGVIPSLYEPFGYVALEMMMYELPIVATATSGLNEVVDDACGLKLPIIEYHDRVEVDTALLAEKIIYLLQHPAEARKIGQNGRKKYLNEYSSNVFKQNMLNFYNSTYDT